MVMLIKIDDYAFTSRIDGRGGMSSSWLFFALLFLARDFFAQDFFYRGLCAGQPAQAEPGFEAGPRIFPANPLQDSGRFIDERAQNAVEFSLVERGRIELESVTLGLIGLRLGPRLVRRFAMGDESGGRKNRGKHDHQPESDTEQKHHAS